MIHSLGAFLLAAAMAASAFALGRPFFFHRTADPSTDEISSPTINAIGLGAGILSLGFLTLGFFSQLTPATVLVWALGPALFGFINLGRLRARVGDLPALSLPVAVFSVATLATVLVAAAACGAPPVVHDAVSTHLLLPWMYLRDGAVRFYPDISTSLWPQLSGMLALPGMASGFPEAIQFIHLGFAVMILVLVQRVAARAGGAMIGAAAALVFVSTPFFSRLATNAFVEMPLMFYTTLAACIALGDAPRRWVWVGVFGGLAVSVKLNAAVWMCLLPLVDGRDVFRQWRRWMMVLTIAAAVSSPWWVRSWVASGNPTWPLAWTVFKGDFWDARQSALFSAYGAGETPLAGVGPLARMGRRLVDALTPGGDPGHPFRSPLLLIALLMVGFRRRAALPSSVNRLILVGGAYFLFYIIGMPLSMRYLVPLVPFAVLATAWTATIPQAGRWIFPVVMAGLVTTGTPLKENRFWVKARVGIGAFDRGRFLEDSLPTMPMARWIDAHLPPDARILLLNDIRGYYLDRRVIWGNPIYQKYISYDGVSTTDALTARWKAAGATHVLVADGDIRWPVDGAEAVADFIDGAPHRREGACRLYPLYFLSARGERR